MHRVPIYCSLYCLTNMHHTVQKHWHICRKWHFNASSEMKLPTMPSYSICEDFKTNIFNLLNRNCNMVGDRHLSQFTLVKNRKLTLQIWQCYRTFVVAGAIFFNICHSMGQCKLCISPEPKVLNQLMMIGLDITMGWTNLTILWRLHYSKGKQHNSPRQA